MKIVLLTKYGNLAASTRQRFQQYWPYLVAEGFELDSRPLLDDSYLRSLYDDNRTSLHRVAASYAKRLWWLLTSKDVDVIWLHCELFPYLPGLFERLARLPGAPIAFDYDDAIFHNYDLHANTLIRGLLGPKLRTTISSAKVSFCGNDYLADYARSFCQRVEIVPTVVDVETYRPRPVSGPGAPRRIGWIGTPSTWNEYMLPMLPFLTDVAATEGARLTAVGGSQTEHPLVDNLPWTEDSEVSLIQAMDVGIMPLPDTPWARGKCGYKLIQYMACGLPVVASPVGVNRQIVEHGVNGFLAQNEPEWREALEILLQNPELGRQMGNAGREKVEREYSLQVHGPRVARTLRDLARSRR